jgi:Glycosyl transferase family 2
MIIIILLAGVFTLELFTHIFGRSSRIRTVFAALAMAGNIASAVGLLAWNLDVFSVLLAILSLYRVLNMLRVTKRRMHEVYLRNATRSTSSTLIGLQLLTGAAWFAWQTWHTTGYATWGAVGVLEALVAAVFLQSVLRTLRRTRWPRKLTHYSDADLPSITVAIPARNETEDLEQCLQSIIASDYPKLEVIVLDDCSQTKRTPEIIKEFAHDGVRFVQGDEPRPTWLPKNQAYERIAKEASGAYILFCGVDVRFAPGSIRNIVSTMLDRNKQMLSVMPSRWPHAYGRLSLVQAMRYWWELVPPRRIFQRPPVLSSCWMISAEALAQTGGFASVARSVVPEAYFAKAMVKTDGYSFMRSDGLGVESTKTIQDQRATAIRMRYPQLHKRPEQVALAALWEITFLLLPFILAVGGFWWHIGMVAHVAAIIAAILLIISYELAVLSTRVNTWWFGLVAQPFAAISDIVLLHFSMWKYEFSTVDWKGRNVCVPVMHVVPHLPPKSELR